MTPCVPHCLTSAARCDVIITMVDLTGATIAKTGATYNGSKGQWANFGVDDNGWGDEEAALRMASARNMRDASALPVMTVEEYFRFEETSPEKYEYVAGEVYAMSGVTRRHDRIATNVLE